MPPRPRARSADPLVDRAPRDRPPYAARIGRIVMRAARKRALDGNECLRTLACKIAYAAACPAHAPHSRDELLKRLSDMAADDVFHASFEVIINARVLPPVACKIAAHASVVAEVVSVAAAHMT